MSGMDGGHRDGCDQGNGRLKEDNSNGTTTTNAANDAGKDGGAEQMSVLQQHIQFWDRDNDGIIWPLDVYRGFRELGFGLFFSIGSLLIPLFFSYPTRLGRSWLPDPALRIRVSDIHRAKHGSDSGVYDLAGNFDDRRFEEMWRAGSFGGGRDDSINSSINYTEKDSGDALKANGSLQKPTQNRPGLDAYDLYGLWRRHCCAADLAGWTFAAMEWWTTWVLLEKGGRVAKEDLRACYDGSLFWKIRDEREKEREREVLRARGRRKRSSSMRNFFYDLS